MRCRNQAVGKEEVVHGLFLQTGFKDDEEIIRRDVYYSDDEKDAIPALSNMDYSIQFREIAPKKAGSKSKKTKKLESLVEVTKHVTVSYHKNKPQSTLIRSGEIVSKYLNQYIKRYQKSLRRLRIEVEVADVENIQLDELTHLEELVLVECSQFGNLLCNTTDKLKTLLLKYKNGNYFNDRGILTREMLKYNIYEAQNVSLTGTLFDEGSFLTLKAVEMDLSVGDIESETINAFIRSWSQGDYKQDFK